MGGVGILGLLRVAKSRVAPAAACAVLSFSLYCPSVDADA